MRTLHFIIGIASILLLQAHPVQAQFNTVQSVNSSNAITNLFMDNDPVFVSGTCSPASNLNVDVYVVLSQGDWDTDDRLTDVRGQPTPMTIGSDAVIPFSPLWVAPLIPGEYDIVVDIDRNGRHSTWEQCIDDTIPVGFTVQKLPEEHSITLERGAQSPPDRSWELDTTQRTVIMEQIVLKVDDKETVQLHAIELKSSGSGDDFESIAQVKAIHDTNLNGRVDSEDRVLSSGRFAGDNGRLELSTNEEFTASSTQHILILYEVNSTVKHEETFGVTIENIRLMGKDSKKDLLINGVPLESSILTIINPEQVCTGPLVSTLSSTTVPPNGTFTVHHGGLNRCDGKTLYVRERSCGGVLTCSCQVKEDGCSCNAIAPNLEDDFQLISCLDMNNDRDFGDPNEQASVNLRVRDTATPVEPDLPTDDELLSDISDIPPVLPFVDTVDHWAETYIALLYATNAIQGKSQQYFAPNDSITRAELIKIVLVAFDYQVDPIALQNPPFTDVEPHAWYMPYIATAYQLGIVSGYSDGTIRPNDPVNRVEALKIILTAAGIDISATSPVFFPDTSASAWYSNFLNFAVGRGIVSGYTTGELAGTFGPERPITRAEVAKIVVNVLSLQ